MQCHDLTFINTLSKTYAFLYECSHVMLMPRALTDSLTHAHVMYEKSSFQKQKIFVLYFNSLDSLQKTALFKSHVSFVGNELFGVNFSIYPHDFSHTSCHSIKKQHIKLDLPVQTLNSTHSAACQSMSSTDTLCHARRRETELGLFTVFIRRWYV